MNNIENLKISTKPNIGLEEENIEKITYILKQLLADEFVLYTKYRNYHWNVKGMNFVQLHELFEKQYTEIITMVDEIAEYIQKYGVNAPGSLTEFLGLTRLEESTRKDLSSEMMIWKLIEDQEFIIKQMREDSKIIGDMYRDQIIEDLLIGFIHKHQEMLWFLRSHLE